MWTDRTYRVAAGKMQDTACFIIDLAAHNRHEGEIDDERHRRQYGTQERDAQGGEEPRARVRLKPERSHAPFPDEYGAHERKECEDTV